MDSSWSKNETVCGKIKSIGIFLIPCALYFVSVDWLNEQHSICLFKTIFGRECYGCGITRAVLSAIHFDFAGAYGYHKAVVLVYPILIYLWLKTGLQWWTQKP